MAAETGFFRGSAGWVLELSLPLDENMQSQVTRHQLVRVANADADPYVAPEAAPDDGLAKDDGPKPPAKNASKNDWVGYALKVDPDLTVDDADAMSRDDLVEKYGSK